MRNWKDIASGLFWIAAGLGMLWVTWDIWEKFAQLESGQLKSMKVWAPVAWIYSGGGTWAIIAKWAFLAFLGLCGAAMIYFRGVAALFPALRGMLVFPALRRMLVNGFQKGPPMCCQRYLKSLAERKNSFADAEEGQRYLRVLRQFAPGDDDYALFVSAGGDSQQPRKGSVQIRFALLGCQICGREHVTEEVKVHGGSDWIAVPSATRQMFVSKGQSVRPAFP